MGIGRRVEARIEGISAEEYLRESVLDPTAYLVNGWGPGMPAYGGVLTTDEVETIVDYLASLR